MINEEDIRFQNLPPDEVYNEFVEVLEKANGRIIKLDNVSWYNFTTREQQTVYNMPVYASMHCSSRPRAISELEVKYYDECGDMIKIEQYTFNKDYCHINISETKERDSYVITRDDKCMRADQDDNKLYKKVYMVYYYEICSPITMAHFYNYDEENKADFKTLFVAQLSGQNLGSRFRSVQSIRNNYRDQPLLDNNGQMIKKNAPLIQLITNTSVIVLKGWIETKQTDKIYDIIGRKMPAGPDEILVKEIQNTFYTKIKADDLENKAISSYYPVITYEQGQPLFDNLPKAEIDMAVFGLGSAGTGILDQVARSTFANSYLICDFDTVENKNLRNQWYTKTDVHGTKTMSSKEHIRMSAPGNAPQVTIYSDRFQEINMDAYEFKYIISGFDSIEARMELLDYIKQDKISAQYLIDARYDDLTCSLFFIDLSNEDEVDYYEKGLQADYDAFIQRERAEEAEFLKQEVTEEQFFEYMRNSNCYQSGCGEFRLSIHPHFQSDPEVGSCFVNDCRSEECYDYLKKVFDNCDKEALKRVIRNSLPEEETSCVKQNFIDIYKYSSAFVFAAMREIESGEPKPFTHVDTSTQVMPVSMLIRK